VSGLGTRHGDLLNGRLGYSMPLAANGLRGELALNRVKYQLADAYTVLDATGHATGADAILSYPLRRTEAQTIGAGLDFAYKSLLDEIGATDTRIAKRSLSATAALAWRDRRQLFGVDGLTQASVALAAGSLHFKDADTEALDAAGADTQGSYSKLNVGAS